MHTSKSSIAVETDHIFTDAFTANVRPFGARVATWEVEVTADPVLAPGTHYSASVFMIADGRQCIGLDVRKIFDTEAKRDAWVQRQVENVHRRCRKLFDRSFRRAA